MAVFQRLHARFEIRIRQNYLLSYIGSNRCDAFWRFGIFFGVEAGIGVDCYDYNGLFAADNNSVLNFFLKRKTDFYKSAWGMFRHNRVNSDRIAAAIPFPEF
jgi:hypothetical protein